jgi:imidazolonepropionase-like amidohydrolase
MKRALLALLLTSAAATAGAQAQPRETAPAAAIVLRAAHLFDGRSGELQSPGLLVVRDGRIAGVGPGAAIPAGAQVIELGDATLLPGFIDAHVHLTADHVDNWAQGFYEGMMRSPVEQSFHAERNARVTLEAGFTSVRNVGSSDFIDVALRNAIGEGLVEGPRIVAAGNAIGSTGGHCDASPFPPEHVPQVGPLQGVCNGPEECRAAVRMQMKFGADVIKICASGGVLSESDPVDVPQLTPAELEAIISEAHAWKRKVAAHAHGDLAARQAVEAGVDSIEHGSFLTTQTLQLMKLKGTYLVPTRSALMWVVAHADSYPPKIRAKALAAGQGHEKAMREAMRIGVKFALGTDAAVYPHGQNGKEFGYLVDIGMSPSQALLSSSLGSARLLGIDDDTGTLEPGKAADVVAVRGNVLQDIRATEAPILVMKQGRLVPLRTGTPVTAR